MITNGVIDAMLFLFLDITIIFETKGVGLFVFRTEERGNA
jgi:hypothetical protein